MTVPSLLNIVRDYVIGDICNVESLRGLPETMGEWLFKAFLRDVDVIGVANRQIHADRDKRRRQRLVHGLTVFCDAYGGLVLTRLSMSRRLAVINEFTDCLIPLMSHVTSLELSHCELGHDHELVQNFVHMRFLRRLSLRNCAVTDDFLRKITIPSRILKKGLVTLNEFDLSCNLRITNKSLSHLSCLKELNVLSLSGTSITTTAAKVFGSKTGMTLVESRFDELTSPSTSGADDGWAAGLVQSWCTDQSSNDNQTIRSKQYRNATPLDFFYSHRKARLRLVEELKSSSAEPSEHPVISLVRYPRSNLSRKEAERPTLQSNILIVDDETLQGYRTIHSESRSDRKQYSNPLTALNILN